jgi:hypothetical protein
MDPRGEALAITGERFDVRIHEPSLPTITEPPYVADLLALGRRSLRSVAGQRRDVLVGRPRGS